MITPPSPANAINAQLRLFDIYNKTKYLSIKHDSYFQVYEQVFGPYVGKNITFVKSVYLNGGSLHMWRDYFGSSARSLASISIPAQKNGKVADSRYSSVASRPRILGRFYKRVGPVDIVLDDGGQHQPPAGHHQPIKPSPISTTRRAAR